MSLSCTLIIFAPEVTGHHSRVSVKPEASPLVKLELETLYLSKKNECRSNIGRVDDFGILYMHLRRKWMSKSFEMDQNLNEKCIILVQKHFGEDAQNIFHLYLFLFLLRIWWGHAGCGATASSAPSVHLPWSVCCWWCCLALWRSTRPYSPWWYPARWSQAW